MSDGGKGSAPRPVEVPRDQFESNWEKIFGKKPKVTSGWRKRGGGRK